MSLVRDVSYLVNVAAIAIERAVKVAGTCPTIAYMLEDDLTISTLVEETTVPADEHAARLASTLRLRAESTGMKAAVLCRCQIGDGEHQGQGRIQMQIHEQNALPTTLTRRFRRGFFMTRFLEEPQPSNELFAAPWFELPVNET